MTVSFHYRLSRALRGRTGITVLGIALLAAISGAVALPPAKHVARQPPPKPTAVPVEATQTVAYKLADEEAPASGNAAAHAGPAPEAIDARSSPEARLIAIYRAVARGRSEVALQGAGALVKDHPNFQLAQLVYADLLAAHASPLTDFGGSAPLISGQDDNLLAALKQEALLRLRALKERPPAGVVPAEFVRLPQTVPFAIAVDTSRARLYLFENRAGGARLIADYYVSIGKQGADKTAEGDQRTPLGVYFVTGQLGAHMLIDRFGTGALPLNYPNPYDKSRGRTGGGILLHGAPADSYARPPLDSDGCVVLANDDLQRLAKLLPPRDTPVVITQQIRWVAQGGPPSGESDFLGIVKDWQRARLRRDRAMLSSFYAATAADAVSAARDNARRVIEPVARIDDWSVLTWGEAPDVRVVTYRELASARDNAGRLMRQYWTQASGRWSIMTEGQVR